MPQQFVAPQIQSILDALRNGGRPAGNQELMPLLGGLGPMQNFVQHASAPQTQLASNPGILAGKQPQPPYG